MPEVRVNLYTTLRQYVGGKPSVDVDVEPGRTIGQVLEELGVPTDHTRVIFLDSRAADLQSPLQGGERVDVFPAIGGG